MLTNWLKNFGSFAVMAFIFCFLFSASLSSCASKGQEAEKETTEKAVEGNVEQSEHPIGEENQEHPNSEEEENPKKKADEEEHPTDGGDDEHPN